MRGLTSFSREICQFVLQTFINNNNGFAFTMCQALNGAVTCRKNEQGPREVGSRILFPGSGMSSASPSVSR